MNDTADIIDRADRETLQRRDLAAGNVAAQRTAYAELVARLAAGHDLPPDAAGALADHMNRLALTRQQVDADVSLIQRRQEHDATVAVMREERDALGEMDALQAEYERLDRELATKIAALLAPKAALVNKIDRHYELTDQIESSAGYWRSTQTPDDDDQRARLGL